MKTWGERKSNVWRDWWTNERLDGENGQLGTVMDRERMDGEEIRKEGGERVSVEAKLDRKLQFLGPLRKEG